MSLALNPLQPVAILDPRCTVNSKKMYGVLEGGSMTSWKPVTSTSYSTSNIQFSAPPPNPRIYVDREILIAYPVQFTFSGTSSGPLLNIGTTDAPRAYPISSTLQSLAVTLNNSQVSINMSDTIQAFLRYGTPVKERAIDYSMTPSMLDQSQTYAQLFGFVRSPLAKYGDNTAEEARGGFPMTVITNASNTAVVQAVFVERIYLSPFLFSQASEESTAFCGLQTMDFNFTLGSLFSGGYMWSHDAVNGNAISSIATTFFSAPQLLFNYITPKELQSIPSSITYPYYSIDRYPSPVVSLAPGAFTTVTSNNIQLNSIPKRLYIFARRQNGDQNFNTTDSFAYITGINVNWNNNSGLLASATPYDLYRVAQKNGTNLSWNQWSSTVGSVLVLEMGTDIALGQLEAPGLLLNAQLQMNVTIASVNPTDTVNYALYVVTISEGVFTIQENRAILQVGVISRDDILNARQMPSVSYQSLQGGDFWGGLKSVFGKVAEGVKTALPYVQKYGPEVIKYGAPLLGLGVTGGRRHKHRGGAQAGGAVAGGRRKKHKKRRGGALVGGKLMSASELQAGARDVDSGSESESD